MAAVAALGLVAAVFAGGTSVSATPRAIQAATSGESAVPGSVIAWGGYGGEVATIVPETARRGVTAVSAGFAEVSLAIKDGGVIAWGDTDNAVMTVPTEARSGVDAVDARGSYHALALKDGAVIAWGFG
jgi:hypothetical protein